MSLCFPVVIHVSKRASKLQTMPLSRLLAQATYSRGIAVFCATPCRVLLTGRIATPPASTGSPWMFYVRLCRRERRSISEGGSGPPRLRPGSMGPLGWTLFFVLISFLWSPIVCNRNYRSSRSLHEQMTKAAKHKSLPKEKGSRHSREITCMISSNNTTN